MSDIRNPALRIAAQHVISQWSNDLGDAIDQTDAKHVLVYLAHATEESRNGKTVPKDSPANTPLGRYLLRTLRAELLREWNASPPTTTDMLEMMQALEDVSAAIEPDWAQYFMSRLSGHVHPLRRVPDSTYQVQPAGYRQRADRWGTGGSVSDRSVRSGGERRCRTRGLRRRSAVSPAGGNPGENANRR